MPRSVPDILAPYVFQLGQLPFVRRVVLGDAPAGMGHALKLTLADDSTANLVLDLRTSNLSKEAAQRVVSRVLSESPQTPPRDFALVLAAPYIGTALGESLKARAIPFIDRQGNCYLNLGDRHVAHIQGRPAPKLPARSKALRAPGYQVLFALLAQPDCIGQTQRELATLAGTSRQPVADLLGRLVEEGVAVRKRGRHAWAQGPDRALLDRWVAGYEATLRPKLEVGRFRLPVRRPEDIEAWLDQHLAQDSDLLRYGGTAGAYRLEPHYRGPAPIVAHLGPPSEPIRQRIKALPASDGELLWMRQIGQLSARGVTEDTVHPLLIFAELISDPDPRAREAAELIRARWLPWST